MTCPRCKHPVNQHSSEPGVGCLEVVGWALPLPGSPDYRSTAFLCDCPLPGTSTADQ